MHARVGGIIYLGVLLIVILLRPDPASHQVISDSVCQSEIIIPRGGHVPVFDEREMEMPVEALANLGHITQPSDAPHADLLPFLAVGQGNGHPGWQSSGCLLQGRRVVAAASKGPCKPRALLCFRAEDRRPFAFLLLLPLLLLSELSPDGCGKRG